MLDLKDLIGKRFAIGGRGPDTYDCWGLVMEVYRRLGIELPDYRSPTDWAEVAQLMRGELYQWIPVGDRTEHAVMYMKTNGDPHHVAVYLGRDRFIHSSLGSRQVVIDRASNWESSIVGYYKYAYDR